MNALAILKGIKILFITVVVYLGKLKRDIRIVAGWLSSDC